MKMKTSDHQWNFLQDIARLIEFAGKHKCYKLTGGQLERPQILQDIYVKQGKSWTSDSDHLRKLAIDFNIFIDGDYIGNIKIYTLHKDKIDLLGYFWESLSPYNYWGGFWKNKDTPHFGRKTYKLRTGKEQFELMERYLEKYREFTTEGTELLDA